MYSPKAPSGPKLSISMTGSGEASFIQNFNMLSSSKSKITSAPNFAPGIIQNQLGESFISIF